MSPTKGEAQKLSRIKNDFPFFAERFLKIRPKDPTQGLIPFRLNRAQQYLHDALEKLRREKGMVRALIVKGRQLGSSTYVGARFYHKTFTQRAMRTFILTHEQEATDALFELTRRYNDNNPLQPSTSRSSAKELLFDQIDSGYRVGTAGSKAVGRGQTVQMFHGSEVAFWPNGEEHIGGVMNAVPKLPGSEIIFESTANGPLGIFYKLCMDAISGKGEFSLIFIPWWWEDSYRLTPPKGWVPPEEFAAYQKANGLTDDQLYWAYIKNGESAAAEGQDRDKLHWLFRQEYPQNAIEAFQTSGQAQFIPGSRVYAARKAQISANAYLPIVLGIDPAQGAHDQTAIIDRQGRRAGRHVFETVNDKSAVQLARRIAGHIRTINPKRVFIDHGGGGKEIADILADMGYGSILDVVNFGARANDPSRFENMRAEMWSSMRDWFYDEVQIPDHDQLQRAITAPEWGPGATREKLDGRLILESKDQIRKRLENFSPDEADALALTFAFPVSTIDEDIFYDDAPRDGGNSYTGY